MPTFKETDELIGSLCAAWANMEHATEQTLWGIIGADSRLGPLITWRLDIRSRWTMILDHAPAKLAQQDVQILKQTNKDVTIIARDRNIIVHGLVTMTAKGQPAQYPLTSAEILEKAIKINRQPCWTVFRGADAGKSFPISTSAVRVVRNNIVAVSERLNSLNDRLGFSEMSTPSDHVETDWPKPID